MNIQQLKYIVAVDNERHFKNAAKACNISQPTLSMMIQKLEEELDLIVFDRSKKPVVPTDAGQDVLELARSILAKTSQLEHLSKAKSEKVRGTLNIGIIPTLAPYLIPLFINSFIDRFPEVQLKVSEITTELIIEQLRKGEIDAGIMVTPVNETSITESPVFYEPFWVYSSSPYKKKYLTAEDIDPEKLWLLEEGHCFRSQIMNLCELKKQSSRQFEYHAGSIETLKQLVDVQQGITIFPELATTHLSKTERKKLMPFKDPVPVREVSICTHRDFVKYRMIDALKQEVINAVPSSMLNKEGGTRVAI